MGILIRNGYVLTLDDQNTIFNGGDVWIEDDLIREVGKGINLQSESVDKIIDASGKIVMPGLVNAHFHGGERLMRGMASGYPNVEIQVLKNIDFIMKDGKVYRNNGKNDDNA